MNFLICILFLFFSLSVHSEGKKKPEEKIDEMTCPDLLSFVALYEAPPDPDANVIFQLCLTYCIAKVALLKRVRDTKSTIEKKQIREQLRIINLILSTALRALRLSFIIFDEPYNLRKKLNTITLEVQEKPSVFQNILD